LKYVCSKASSSAGELQDLFDTGNIVDRRLGQFLLPSPL